MPDSGVTFELSLALRHACYLHNAKYMRAYFQSLQWQDQFRKQTTLIDTL